MFGLALQSLRHRWSGFVATFVAMFFCAALMMASGGLLQTTFGQIVPAQRLAAAPVVIAGDQNYKLPDNPTPFLLAEQVPVDAGLLSTVAATPGVATAVGDVNFPAVVLSGGQPLSTQNQLLSENGTRIEVKGSAYGHGWASAQLAPYSLTAGTAPTGPGQVVLDTATAQAAGLTVGGTARIQLRGAARDFTVSGIVAAATPVAQTSVFFSDAQAQQLTTRPGTFDAIAVLPTPGTDPAALAQQLAAPLAGHGATVLTGDRRGLAEFPEAQRVTDLTITSTVFALLALLAGLFGVSSTLGLAYQQRKREMALLRAVGSTPRQVRRMIRGEALVVSLLASVVAIAPAWFLGRALYSAIVESGIGPAGIEFHQGPGVVVVATVIGLLTATAAARIAGRRLAVTKPTAALGEAETQRTRISWPRVVLAWVFIALAVVMAMATAGVQGPLAASPAAFVSILLAIGLGLLGPFVTKVLTWVISPVLQLFTGLSGYLGALNAKARAARIAAVATPVMLLTAIATTNLYLVTTEQAVSNAGYVGNLHADLVLQSGPTGFAPDALTAVGRVDGVGAAAAYATSTGFVEYPVNAAAGKDLAGWPLEGITAAGAAQIGVSSTTAGNLADLSGNTVALTDTYAASLQRGIGDTLTMRLGDGTQVDTKIVATFPSPSSFEKVLLPVDLLAAHTPAGAPVRILVKLAPGADAAAVRAQLTSLAGGIPGSSVTDSGALAGIYAGHLQSQALVSYLIVAMIAGYTIITIINNLALATAQRRREFGLARLIGTTRGQLLRMVTFEGVLTALIGLVLGTLLIPTTLVPFSLNRWGSPMWSGPLWGYLAVIGTAAVVTLVATTVPAWAVLRRRPLEDVAIG